ncbi:MAG: ABC transporter ATP-binding protein [Actinomycetia bacterium]|nr:ABC transporter ATP-binding protein [Actinomycetes bacterium]
MILIAERCTVRGEGEQLRLDRVDISVGEGEIHAIIGPNGAGKSTLMGVLSGMLKVHSGAVTFQGSPLHDLGVRDLARARSILGQDLAVSFGFTVAEVVAWGRTPWRGSRDTAMDSQRIEHAIELTQIGGLRNRRINQLSGGERKRVHIARVIAQDTPLMFFDEPDSDLDLVGADQLDQMLINLRESGRTLVLSSHNLSWISGLATHVILMGEGKVIAAGPTREVMNQDHLSRAYKKNINVLWSSDSRGREIAMCSPN